jgi:SAM-dependent methyltransferase
LGGLLKLCGPLPGSREEYVRDQHYKGLIAKWYDDWLKERTDDRDYYSGFFSGFDGRVLELACGTGRLLIPIPNLLCIMRVIPLCSRRQSRNGSHSADN